MCHAVRVESQDGWPFVGASWCDRVAVCLSPRRLRVLPLRLRHHRRLLHAYLQSPAVPYVRARRRTMFRQYVLFQCYIVRRT